MLRLIYILWILNNCKHGEFKTISIYLQMQTENHKTM